MVAQAGIGSTLPTLLDAKLYYLHAEGQAVLVTCWRHVVRSSSAGKRQLGVLALEALADNAESRQRLGTSAGAEDAVPGSEGPDVPDEQVGHAHGEHARDGEPAGRHTVRLLAVEDDHHLGETVSAEQVVFLDAADTQIVVDAVRVAGNGGLLQLNTLDDRALSGRTSESDCAPSI